MTSHNNHDKTERLGRTIQLDGSTQPNVIRRNLVSLYGVRLAVAIGTIDRSVAAGFKRHLGVFAASSALDGEHLPGS